MTIIVGGQARKVGKTRAVCDIVRATPEVRWVAAKITAHPHVDSAPGVLTDTGRYLAAGAAEAYLLGSVEELPAAPFRIVESNAAAATLEADLVVFLRDRSNADWKQSADVVAHKADIVAECELTSDDLRRIRDVLGLGLS